jgi:Lipoate-protein ligase A
VGTRILLLKTLRLKVLENLTENICAAFARGISKLGINAKFRPRNDIEVDGRKISGTGGTYESSVYFFQGTLLLDFNPENMVKSLKIPVEKLTSKNFSSILSRVTSVKSILGRIPDLNLIKSAVLSGFQEHLGLDFFTNRNYRERRRFFKRKPPVLRFRRVDLFQ